MATTSLQGAYDQTRRWIESNDPERATGLAQHILQHFPNNLEAYRILGEAYLARRQLDKAQDAFERVLNSDPENIPAHVGLGITFERQGKLDRAVPEFEQAWEIKPDMAELRSQLLRLYADAWGSEHAQLRLSRAGLARLYAKGHMLPQAISEFRQVIADQPNRHDATTALAEALWRDGQEKESMALCRDILAQRPTSLKANLLLGYLLLAQGQPEGQRYWDMATQIDPFMTVAKAMFETLPSAPPEDIELPAWDEAAWQRQQEQERQPVPAATRPIPLPNIAAAPLRTATAAAPANDDFLAVLLAGGGAAAGAAVAEATRPTAAPTPQPEPSAAVTVPLVDSAIPTSTSHGDDSPLAPFSLADLGLSEDEITGLDQNSETTQPGAINPPTANATPVPFAFDTLDDDVPQMPTPNESALTPFSLGDLGFSDDEIANLNDAGQNAPPASAPATTEPALTPFSLGDLGLSDDEIANLNDAGQNAPPASAPATTEPALTPFSLGDLGLSDDEIANLNDAGQNAQPASAAATTEPALTPFSLGDLGLSDDEIASLNDVGQDAPPPAQPASAASTSNPALTPFSLSDLGLSDDEIASLNDLNASDAQPSTPATDDADPVFEPFSLSDLGLTDDEIASLEGTTAQSAAAETGVNQHEQEPFSTDLLPFSLDEIDADEDTSSLPSSLEAFSLDEVAPESPRASNLTAPDNYNRVPELNESDDDSTTQSGGYSWQQPTQRIRPNYLSSTPHRDPLMPEGESIFDKLKQRRGQEIEPTIVPEQAPIATDATPADDRMLFSMDDVSLRDDQASSGSTPGTPAQSPVVPQPDAPPANDDLNTGLSSGQIQPFSLTDLGLSAEEIAALGLGGSSGAAQNFSTMLNAEAPAAQPAAQTQPDTTFDAIDFGSDDFSAFSAAPTDAAPQPTNQPAETPPTQAVQGLAGESDVHTAIDSLSPFSLADLGLSDEEIAELGLDDLSEDTSGLRITEEELAGLDMGGDLDLSAIHSTPIDAPGTSDALLDRLLTLGREQGYVDIADIIAGVANPEAEAERIEQIGQLLHENKIKIFDGDEEVDMDAEYAAEESADFAPIDFDQPATVSSEPDMTPFSLADLGLSDEEIASLGLGETATTESAPAAAEPAASEPAMTPFSLADLGLSDEEIASLGLGETTPLTQNEQPTTATTDEPDMTPFSFADLGLSDEEIASLGSAGSAEVAEPATVEVAKPVELAAVMEQTTPAQPLVTSELPPAATPAPVAAPAPTPAPPRQVSGLSDSLAEQVPALAGYVQQLHGNPANHTLRLSLARISGQIGQTEAAIQQYKNIIRQNVLLDVVVADLGDLLGETDDATAMQRIHRLLGDAYSKQGRIDEAMTEYNWIYGTSPTTS